MCLYITKCESLVTGDIWIVVVIHDCDGMFSFCVSVWGRHVANVPVPHHGRKPPSDPGADGGECALPAYSSTVCQTAAGGRRRQVTSENC